VRGVRLPRSRRIPPSWPARPRRDGGFSGALAGIPEAQRQVLLLAYFHGLSQSEIASRLDQPLGTVKSHARLGLRKLRTLLRSRPANRWGTR